MSTRGSLRHRDDGASLVFVLAFVTGVGLVVSGLLSFAGGALGGVSSTKYRNDVSYDADGALKAGITQIRTSKFANKDSTLAECNGYLNNPAAGTGATNGLSISGPNLKRATVVTCQGGPKTGLSGGATKIDGQNMPDHSLLTLDTGASGLQLADSKSAFLIEGSAFINGPIDVNPGNVIVHGDFSAFGGKNCDSIKSETPPNCSPAAHVGDPGLLQPSSSGDFTYRTPACPTDGSKTVSLSPGFYSDAAALNALTDAGCSTAHTVHLTGGTYYFDFKNSGSHVWNVADSDVRVIGGKPNGWSTATGYTGAATGAAGACVAPEDRVSNDGVTLIFGGDSAVNVSAGRFEICAPYSATSPPVAIYGAKSTVAATTSHPGALVAGTGIPATPNKLTSYNIDASDLPLLRSDEKTDPSAVFATVTDKKAAGALFPQFGGALAIPVGATVTSATITVNHREHGVAGEIPAPNVTVTTSSGASIAATPAGTSPLAKNVASTYVSQTATLGSSFAEAVRIGGLQSLDVQYEAPVSAKTDYTSYLEYLKVDITWVGPGLSAQAAAGPTVLTGPGDAGAILIAGTTYAPRSVVAVDLKKGGRVNFGWGMIARQVTMKTYGNTDQPSDMPIFGMPQEVHGPDVYFTSYVYRCAGNSLVCSAPSYPNAGSGAWVRAATALATFDSPNPDMANPQNRAVTIRSWTVYR